MAFIIFFSILFCIASFILLCIVHISTPYDRLADDRQQEEFLKSLPNRRPRR